MQSQLARRLTSKFDDELRFFKTWIDRPKALGAVLPTSAFTARRMAGVIRAGTGAPVLELGPGTGVITKAILDHGVAPHNLYSVEYTGSFVPALRNAFPGVHVLEGDAFDLDTALAGLDPAPFDAVISAIPMLTFPPERRLALMEDLFDRLAPGRPVVQISYGPASPIPPNPQRFTVEPLEWVMRNVPPARLWTYRRLGNG